MPRARRAEFWQGARVPTATTPPGRRAARSGKVVLLLVLGVLLMVFVPAVVVPTLLSRPTPPKLDDFGPLPALSLVDEEGRVVTADDLRGTVIIVGLIFTRCDSVCPVVSMKMQRIQQATADAGARIKLLSITVDPEFDTPAVLAEYARRFEADPRRWRFLTGPLDQVKALVEGPLMTGMERRGVTATGAPDLQHGQHFVLLDGDLHVRQVYDSTVPERIDDLVRAARWLSRRLRR